MNCGAAVAKIKLCGLFREADIDFANEALPDYIGFVFAPSRRRIEPKTAEVFRARLNEGISPVGVFVDPRIEDVAALCRGGIISLVQLHGGEDASFIMRLKERCDAPVIKALKITFGAEKGAPVFPPVPPGADYYLLDSGAGSGVPLDWEAVFSRSDTELVQMRASLFLAGGIDLANIDRALSYRCRGVDVSSGAETGGVKDRKKMIELVQRVRNGSTI
jgi:phosphoribosylanthranilate isomerase